MNVREQMKVAADVVGGKEMWHQRPRETGIAFEAFLMYREMGLRRSLANVARTMGRNEDLIRRWNKTNDWQLRVTAWDQRMVKERDEAALEEARDMGRRQARLGMRLQSIGGDRLEDFASKPELRETLTAGDTVRLIREGATLEREARGEDSTKAVSGNIIFNLNMPNPPRWAPARVVEQVKKALEGKVIDADGDNTQEATP